MFSSSAFRRSASPLFSHFRHRRPPSAPPFPPSPPPSPAPDGRFFAPLSILGLGANLILGIGVYEFYLFLEECRPTFRAICEVGEAMEQIDIPNMASKARNIAEDVSHLIKKLNEVADDVKAADLPNTFKIFREAVNEGFGLYIFGIKVGGVYVNEAKHKGK